tara:strand:+ start:152 stop:367 length:216 start_codon:yes stop_codon:yes gene_type:complete
LERYVIRKETIVRGSVGATSVGATSVGATSVGATSVERKKDSSPQRKTVAAPLDQGELSGQGEVKLNDNVK